MGFNKSENTATQTAQTQSGTQVKNPWDQQTPYLQDAFSQAKNLYGSPNQSTPYSQQTAGFTPDQLSTFHSMVGTGTNDNTPARTAATGAALSTAGLGLNSTADAMRTQGTGILSSAATGLSNYNSSGSVGNNITAAGQYANNPYIDSQVTAAMRDATRSVNEQALPSIARSSAASGNTFSNRRGISEGIVQRGLADATADTSANLRGAAYSQGLNLAQNASQFADTTKLQALQGQGALGQGMLSAGNAASGLGLGALSQSVGASNSALDQQSGLYSLANAGGAGLQAANQVGLDNAYSAGIAGQQTPWQNLQNYLSVVGGQQWGGTTNSNGTTTGTEDKTKTTTPGILDYLAVGADAFGKFK